MGRAGLSRNDARRSNRLRIYCRALEGNLRELSGDEDRLRSLELDALAAVAFEGRLFRAHARHGVRSVWSRLSQHEPGGARSRNLDLGAQTSPWRSSGFDHVHCEFGYRARRCWQSKALKETIDGQD